MVEGLGLFFWSSFKDSFKGPSKGFCKGSRLVMGAAVVVVVAVVGFRV